MNIQRPPRERRRSLSGIIPLLSESTAEPSIILEDSQSHPAPFTSIVDTKNLQQSANISHVSLSNLQIFVVGLNTVTVRPLHKFITAYAKYLEDFLGLTATQIGYIVAAKALGSAFAIFFPALIYYTNAHCFKMSFRGLLFSLHMILVALCASFIVYDAFWFFFANRFLFGIFRTLFSVYRTVMGAAYSSSSERLWVYSLFYLATPLGTPLLLAFGFLLKHENVYIALGAVTLPSLLSGFALGALPSDVITYTHNSAGTPPMTPITHHRRRSTKKRKKKVKKKRLDFKYMYMLLFDVDRALLMFSITLIGIYYQAFTLCISHWMSDNYGVDAASYWVVIYVMFTAEMLGALTTLLKIHRKIVFLQNGIIIFNMAILPTCLVTLVISLTEFSDTLASLPYWPSLLLVGIVYYMSSISSIACATVTMCLVPDDNKMRTQFTMYVKLGFSAGTVAGSLLGTQAYEKGGITYVAAICCLLSGVALLSTIGLGCRMFRKMPNT